MISIDWLMGRKRVVVFQPSIEEVNGRIDNAVMELMAGIESHPHGEHIALELSKMLYERSVNLYIEKERAN